jgi:predicted urease superfamily metal-dependent hydrolase
MGGTIAPTHLEQYRRVSEKTILSAAKVLGAHPGEAMMDIEFDFTKTGARTKQDVINTLIDIVSKATDAAQELDKQLRATTDSFKPKKVEAELKRDSR